jgi:cytidylate kinase
VETSYPQFLAHLCDLGASFGRPDHVVGKRGHQDLLIAIDGPAGSGKSTLSHAVAQRLGIARLDTGAMYRSVAWASLEAGIDPEDAPAVAEVARGATIELEGDVVTMNGTDVTNAIRTPEVSAAVSIVAANPDVRREMVARQREWAKAHGGGVVEGRDIGSVVFPSATIKVFLTASLDERRRRRTDEAPESVSRRDEIDSTRTVSPLAVADGARVLDTTGRSVEDVVEEVLSWL